MRDLSKITIEDAIKYSAQGFEFEINDGKVVRMVMRRKEGDGENE